MNRAICLSLALFVAQADQAPPRPTLKNLLDRYDQGNYDDAVEAATAWAGLETRSIALKSLDNVARTLPVFARQLEQEAPTWIAVALPEARPRRRLIVAAFAIEVAYSQLSRPIIWAEAHVSSLIPIWQESWPLIRWASDVVAVDPQPSQIERLWWLASVDLIQHFGSHLCLYPVRPDATPQYRAALERDYGRVGYLSWAKTRVPGEPQFRVTAALRNDVPQDQQTTDLEYSRLFSISRKREVDYDDYLKLAARAATVRSQFRLGTVKLTGADRALLTDAEQLGALDRVGQALRPLELEQSVRSEVHMHLGLIAWTFRRHDIARGYLSDIAPWTSEPCLQYVGHHLLGRLSESDGDRVGAEAAYRAALSVVPRARAATTSLATLLWLTDRSAEASATIGASATGPPREDPWVRWGRTAGCSQWPTRIRDLRASFR